ncbi:hypothetical protein PAL_GLEAN10025093 [Pteropus alecto]|uniref:Uncharacterized protein n=1 Tax=Pteropus alecto TaxID=9402 RepID=L5KJU2_PTEAL|nr:hypothetical protein PAL_GLEAN10025093 [Pteropus alecto]
MLAHSVLLLADACRFATWDHYLLITVTLKSGTEGGMRRKGGPGLKGVKSLDTFLGQEKGEED